MRINKVKLSNFAQHKNLEVDISENIVGIIGRNGSGKSNFAEVIVYGAILAALLLWRVWNKRFARH